MTRHRLRLHSRQGKQHMTDIPLATILRINAARTIPLTRYEEAGNFDRFGYIKDLAENHGADLPARSEEHTSELQSLMRISYAVFCLKKKKKKHNKSITRYTH